MTIGAAGEYFRSNPSKFWQKINKNVNFFVKISKILAHAFWRAKEMVKVVTFYENMQKVGILEKFLAKILEIMVKIFARAFGARLYVSKKHLE